MNKVVYYRRRCWRSVSITKRGRADYELEMHDLYQRQYQPFTNLKVAMKEATKLIKEAH